MPPTGAAKSLLLDEFIRSDEDKTGKTLIGRQGLAELKDLAKQKPKPFDYILIDDTSRFGRNLPDVLKLHDVLRFNQVFLYFTSDDLRFPRPTLPQALRCACSG